MKRFIGELIEISGDETMQVFSHTGLQEPISINVDSRTSGSYRYLAVEHARALAAQLIAAADHAEGV